MGQDVGRDQRCSKNVALRECKLETAFREDLLGITSQAIAIKSNQIHWSSATALLIASNHAKQKFKEHGSQGREQEKPC